MGIFVYFGEFFSGILVYHSPPWPTLKDTPIKMFQKNGKKLCIFKQTRPPNQTLDRFPQYYWYRIVYSQNADISLEKGPNSKREAMRCGLYSQATQASAQDMSVHRLWDSN